MRLRVIVVLGLSLVTCGVALGDLSRTATSSATLTGHAATRAPIAEHDGELGWLVDAGTRRLLGAPLAGAERADVDVPRAGTGVAGQQIETLPPAPSSLSLGLSALLGLGAYQATRSLRKLSLGALPDWYHADAVQIGHVTPLELEFDRAVLPVCVFAEPSDFRRGFSYRISGERRAPHVSEAFVPITAPRAPPADRGCING